VAAGISKLNTFISGLTEEKSVCLDVLVFTVCFHHLSRIV